jgi:coproporphyrinogen III oxidase
LQDFCFQPNIHINIQAIKKHTKEQIADWFNNLQGNICEAVAKIDGKASFESDV